MASASALFIEITKAKNINKCDDCFLWYIVSSAITLWLTGARKEAKPTEARPVEPRVRPDRVRCRA